MKREGEGASEIVRERERGRKGEEEREILKKRKEESTEYFDLSNFKSKSP